jgi:hypothetical protein
MSALSTLANGTRKVFRVVGFGAALKAVKHARAAATPEVVRTGAAVLRADLATATHKSTRAETFEAACARLGVRPGELPALQVRLARYARLWRIAGHITMLVGAVYAAGTTDGVAWALGYLLESLAVAALFYTRAFRDSFRAWQIGRRELAPVTTFIGEAGIYTALVSW